MSLSAFEKEYLSPHEQDKILKSKQGYDKAKAQGNSGLMQSYHRQAEQIRRGKGFAGGGSGSGYTPVNVHRDINVPQIDPYKSKWEDSINMYMDKFMNPEQYENPYADQIETLLDLMDKGKEYVPKYQSYIDQSLKSIMNYKPFEYNPDTDPSYQRFLENVKGTAEQAYEDNIAGFSDMSGGYISSWAESAANQAKEAMNLQAQEAVS